jgi:hypothetical protein
MCFLHMYVYIYSHARIQDRRTQTNICKEACVYKSSRATGPRRRTCKKIRSIYFYRVRASFGRGSCIHDYTCTCRSEAYLSGMSLHYIHKVWTSSLSNRSKLNPLWIKRYPWMNFLRVFCTLGWIIFLEVWHIRMCVMFVSIVHVCMYMCENIFT